MAVTYPNALKQDRLQKVIDRIDGGAGPGTLEICTAGYASVLAVLTLADPCGVAVDDTLTFDFDPDISDASANATGTPALARIKDSDGNIWLSGLTVGTAGTNIVLDDDEITAGQQVTITAGTITHS